MKFRTMIGNSATALVLAFAGTACAQQQKPAPVAPVRVAAEDVAIGSPALWKVADEDTTVYLFGTVHALPEDVEWYRGDVAQALAASGSFVTEIYMKPGSEATAQQEFLTKGILPEDQTLRQLLSDEQKVSYEAALENLGVPAATFDRFEPWFAAVNLSMIPLLKAGYSPESGVEKVLEEKAGDKVRGELETIATQVDIFDSLPMETQITFLMETADNIDEIVPMIDKIVDEWVTGDPAGLGSLLNENMSDPVLAEALLYARNRNWAEWIDTRMDDPGTVFIAVGAGHLAGEQSVQDALGTRGFVVTRVQ